MSESRNGSDNAWKSYVLGVLMLLVSATSGVAYNNVTSRISDLEKRDMPVDIAVLKLDVSNIKKTLIDIQNGQEELRGNQLTTLRNQETTLASQKLTKQQLDDLLRNIISNSQRWNEEMDRYNKARGIPNTPVKK